MNPATGWLGGEAVIAAQGQIWHVDVERILEEDWTAGLQVGSTGPEPSWHITCNIRNNKKKGGLDNSRVQSSIFAQENGKK